MPAQWTGEILGKMHLHGVNQKQLAAKLGFHPKYVSMVLNGKREAANHEKRFNEALDEIILEKS